MSSSKKEKKIDEDSGVETTGHEWDGISELNNPAPRWCIIVFFICFAWAIGYWVVYPAWPTISEDNVRGGTKGAIGWTQYSQLKEQQKDIIASKSSNLAKLQNSSFQQIMNDPILYAFSIAGGKSAFKDNCATCHGSGGAGSRGYPNLNDDEWIWGGRIEDIYKTIQFGIRSSHPETRLSEMPNFGEMLSRTEISDIVDYVIHLNKGGDFSPNGVKLYNENCTICHGKDGKGNQELGAPNIANNIWLYGETEEKEIITEQLIKAKHGVMPAWIGRLDDDTIRQLAIYVHSFGGGK